MSNMLHYVYLLDIW